MGILDYRRNRNYGEDISFWSGGDRGAVSKQLVQYWTLFILVATVVGWIITIGQGENRTEGALPSCITMSFIALDIIHPCCYLWFGNSKELWQKKETQWCDNNKQVEPKFIKGDLASNTPPVGYSRITSQDSAQSAATSFQPDAQIHPGERPEFPSGLYFFEERFFFNTHADGHPDNGKEFRLVCVSQKKSAVTSVVMPWYRKICYVDFWCAMGERMVLNQCTVFFTQWAGPFKQIAYPSIAIFFPHLFLGAALDQLTRSFTK